MSTFNKLVHIILQYSFLLMVFLCFLIACESDEKEFGDKGPIPEKIDFNFDVKPILSDRCFACHGPDEEALEAGLHLDTKEGAFAPLGEEKDRYAIVPGQPDDSELYKRISSDDPDFRMPPPESNLKISGREVAILRRWIEQGAEYEKHWSFIPPEKPDFPQVEDEVWPQNPIDHFVLSKLEEKGMQPSPQASKEKLIRRLSFDLTGLPPSVEEVNAFLADSSADAYEKVVDRLLASPAYGERMAMNWLDIARYADTHGYQDDGPNHMWPWRDWVIDAFNSNMGFDEFTTLQLAGDLLPDASREQKLATGFNRVHMQNQEGGIVGEEYRVEYVADRTNTTATAFLGVTMECARCHDHKYDPVSQKDYYQLSAFFNNVNEVGQIPNVGASGPTIMLPDSATEEKIHFLDRVIEEKENEIASLKNSKSTQLVEKEYPSDLASYAPGSEGLIGHITFDKVTEETVAISNSDSTTGKVKGELKPVTGYYSQALEFEKGNSINLGDIAKFERTEPFSFSLWVNPSDTSSGSEAPLLVKTGAIFIGYRGYDVSLLENKISVRLIHGWPYNAIQVKTLDSLPLNQWNHVGITYDGSSRAEGIQVFVNGQQWKTDIHHDNLFKNIIIGEEEETYPRQDFLLGERNSFEKIEYTGLKLDELQIFDRRLSQAEILTLSGRNEQLSKMLASAPAQREAYQQQILLNHYLLRQDEELNRQANKLRELRRRKSHLTDTLREVMVMGERIKPRQTYLLKRGIYTNRGEKVEPDVPESVMHFPEELPRNRLGLARWLLSPEHPLTARVMVNRYWQMYFGKGIVDTPGDFGNQGSLPTHPKLLDWLAVTFRESGWDVKAMQKLIVMSQTYRQSAIMTDEKLEQDPSNKYLARGPRFRMTAEMIRDNALAASGLLVEEVGGPSVKPYQPEGLWQEKTSGRHLTEYVQDHGDSLYRRSLYTFWKRTSPPPFMTTFDAPGRGHTTVKRGRTSTPLQALFTLNDPQFVEASRMLAERMIKEGGDSLQSRIAFGFKVATSRSPDTREIKLLSELYRQELEAFEAQPERIDSLLAVGEYPLDENVDSAKMAAGTLVASTILNLDETITKE